MEKYQKELKPYEAQIPLDEFMQSFNENMPIGFLQVTESQLIKFKESHMTLFKHGDLWSLDQHRKKIIDWLPRNNVVS